MRKKICTIFISICVTLPRCFCRWSNDLNELLFFDNFCFKCNSNNIHGILNQVKLNTNNKIKFRYGLLFLYIRPSFHLKINESSTALYLIYNGTYENNRWGSSSYQWHRDSINASYFLHHSSRIPTRQVNWFCWWCQFHNNSTAHFFSRSTRSTT